MIVGVTGGMGSGKSLVARYLGKLLAIPVVDADSVCRSLLEPQKLGWQGMQHHFGNRFFDLSGHLDRTALRQTLFADSEVRRIVEQILHPLVRQEIHALSRQSQSAGAGQVSLLAEVPLLFEVGWQDDFDWVVVVYADNACCARRIMRRDGVSLDEALLSLQIQLPLFDKAWRADSVIENSGSLTQTLLQLHHLAHLWSCQQEFF